VPKNAIGMGAPMEWIRIMYQGVIVDANDMWQERGQCRRAHGFKPYPISYLDLWSQKKRKECNNS